MAVAELVARQHGVVSRLQLLGIGLSTTAIDRRLATGRLHRIHAGVYAAGHAELTLAGRWTAVVLAAGPDGLLSHQTGTAAWEVLPAGSGPVHVSTPRRSRVRIEGAVLHRPRTIHPEDRAIRDGMPVTALPRTLLDVAETVPRHRLERAFREALRRDLLDFDALDRLLRRSTGRRGLRPLSALAARHAPLTPWTRTGLERCFFDLCVSAGLPTPAMNVWVEKWEVDALWTDHGVIAELDGGAFHSDPAAVEEDRLKDTGLTIAGYRVVRISDRRLRAEPEAVVRDLWAILGCANPAD